MRTVLQLTVAALIAAAVPAHAGLCAPEKLVRIVTRDMTPGIDQQSFAATPKVLYRLGSRQLRLEEQMDPAMNLHGLIVVDAPNTWMIDLVSKSAQLIVDPDPTPDVHSPIFADESIPQALQELEFGCEAAFIAHPDTGHEQSKAANGTATKHFIRSGPWKLTLVTREGIEGPQMALLLKDEKVVQAIRYASYQVLDEVPAGLFAVPAGIEIRDSTRP